MPMKRRVQRVGPLEQGVLLCALSSPPAEMVPHQVPHPVSGKRFRHLDAPKAIPSTVLMQTKITSEGKVADLAGEETHFSNNMR